VGPTYSIVSFLREYQRIVAVIRKKEEEDDNQSKQKQPKQLHYGYMIEQQAMEIYNRNIFLKFMNQLRQVENYKYKEIEKGRTFEVWYQSNQINQREVIRKYVVLTDLSEGAKEFSCICAKFNKDGIFCSHILKVIVEEEVQQILEKYFIERWRKKEKKIQILLVQELLATHQLLRFNKLSRQASVLTSKTAKREIATEYLSEEFKKSISTLRCCCLLKEHLHF
jgi:hypothetical protein